MTAVDSRISAQLGVDIHKLCGKVGLFAVFQRRKLLQRHVGSHFPRIFPADAVGNGSDKGSFQLAFLVIICKNSLVDKNGVLIAIADGTLIGNSAAIIQNGHLTIMIIHILHIRTDNIIIHPSYVFFNAHFL